MAVNILGSETLFIGTWLLTSDTYASANMDSRMITAITCYASLQSRLSTILA